MIRNDLGYLRTLRVRRHLERMSQDIHNDTVTRTLAGSWIAVADGLMARYDRDTGADTRRGRWDATYSGRRFWLTDPRPMDVEAVDIAHNLSRLARYNGGTCGAPYSVAQHCVIGSYLIEPRFAAHFLLHDAPEAYTGDIVTPIKDLMRAQYEAIEGPLFEAINTRFGVTWSDEAQVAVKATDNDMLVTESEYLLSHQTLSELPSGARIHHELGDYIAPWAPNVAKKAYLVRLAELINV